MTKPLSAQERRLEIQANAARMRIDDAYISLLVDTFYSRVREHEQLSPVFEKALAGKWDHHLSKMKDFWASVAFNAGRYSGQPGPKHRALDNVEEHHFEIWLNLFEQTLIDTAPTEAAAPYLMARANRIAASLKLMMFGLPALRQETPG